MGKQAGKTSSWLGKAPLPSAFLHSHHTHFASPFTCTYSTSFPWPPCAQTEALRLHSLSPACTHTLHGIPSTSMSDITTIIWTAYIAISKQCSHVTLQLHYLATAILVPIAVVTWGLFVTWGKNQKWATSGFLVLNYDL